MTWQTNALALLAIGISSVSPVVGDGRPRRQQEGVWTGDGWQRAGDKKTELRDPDSCSVPGLSPASQRGTTFAECYNPWVGREQHLTMPPTSMDQMRHDYPFAEDLFKSQHLHSEPVCVVRNLCFSREGRPVVLFDDGSSQLGPGQAHSEELRLMLEARLGSLFPSDGRAHVAKWAEHEKPPQHDGRLSLVLPWEENLRHFPHAAQHLFSIHSVLQCGRNRSSVDLLSEVDDVVLQGFGECWSRETTNCTAPSEWTRRVLHAVEVASGGARFRDYRSWALAREEPFCTDILTLTDRSLIIRDVVGHHPGHVARSRNDPLPDPEPPRGTTSGTVHSTCPEGFLTKTAHQTLSDALLDSNQPLDGVGARECASPPCITILDRARQRQLSVSHERGGPAPSGPLRRHHAPHTSREHSLEEAARELEAGLVAEEGGGQATVVRFENTSFAFQLATMRATDVLVAVHGAGITNFAFAPHCAAVVEIFPCVYFHPMLGPLSVNSNHPWLPWMASRSVTYATGRSGELRCRVVDGEAHLLSLRPHLRGGPRHNYTSLGTVRTCITNKSCRRNARAAISVGISFVELAQLVRAAVAASRRCHARAGRTGNFRQVPPEASWGLSRASES